MQEMEIKISNNNLVNKNMDIRDYSILKIFIKQTLKF